MRNATHLPRYIPGQGEVGWEFIIHNSELLIQNRIFKIRF